MNKILIIILLAGTLGAAGYAVAQGRAYRDMAFRADSLEAATDEARDVSSDLERALGDSASAWQQRVVQVELERDDLDRELKARPVVRIPGKLVMDTLWLTDTVPPEPTEPLDEGEDESVERYELDEQQGPFHVFGSFQRYPGPTGPLGVFDVAVALSEPVAVGVHVGCLDRAGVNAATVTLTAGDPFSLIPTSPIQQDPGVCNPPVGFSLLPEISLKGIGWEIAKIFTTVFVWERFIEKDNYRDWPYPPDDANYR